MRENPMTTSIPETVERPEIPPADRLIGSELRWVRVVAKGVDMQIKCTKASEDRILKAASESALADYPPNK